MKVLHLPCEIAGQMGILTKALRERGIKATSLNFFKNPFGFKCDIEVNFKKGRGAVIKRNLIAVPYFLRFLSYDIFHFHFGNSFFLKNLDLPFLKLFGKKIIFHFHGSDIRNPEYLKALAKGFKKLPPKIKKTQKERLERIKRFADKILVSTPDLLEIAGQEATFLPVAIDLKEIDRIKPFPFSSKKEIKIFHAPSNPQIKGTKFIIKAIEALKKEKYKIKFKIATGLPRKKILRLCKASDIVIDQLLMGWYGMISVEAMAFEKPVLCFIREDLKKFVPSLPILNTSPQNLILDLKKIIEDEELRKKLGKEGREFVEKFHSKEKVAEKLIKIYKSVYER